MGTRQRWGIEQRGIGASRGRKAPNALQTQRFTISEPFFTPGRRGKGFFKAYARNSFGFARSMRKGLVAIKYITPKGIFIEQSLHFGTCRRIGRNRRRNDSSSGDGSAPAAPVGIGKEVATSEISRRNSNQSAIECKEASRWAWKSIGRHLDGAPARLNCAGARSGKARIERIAPTNKKAPMNRCDGAIFPDPSTRAHKTELLST